MDSTEFSLGERLIPYPEDPCQQRATIRFIGQVHTDRRKRVWLGLELDVLPHHTTDDNPYQDVLVNPPGYLGHTQYFTVNEQNVAISSPPQCMQCKRFVPVLPSTPFILASSVDSTQRGISFFDELELRYGCTLPGRSRKYPVDSSQSIDFFGKRVDFVEFNQAAQHFQNISQLECLDFQHGSISHSGVKDVLDKMSNVNTSPRHFVEQLFQKLKRLSLRHNLLYKVKDVREILLFMPHLESLDLSENRFLGFSEDAKQINTLGTLPKTFHDVKSQEMPPKFLTLLQLELNNTNVCWEAVMFFYTCFPHLNGLDLSGNPQLFRGLMPEAFEKKLQESRKWNHDLLNLKELKLQYCAVHHYQHLMALCVVFPQLTCLNLNGNCLGDITLTMLNEWPKESIELLNALEELFLQDNHIHSLETLYCLSCLVPNLRNLRLQGNDLSASPLSNTLIHDDMTRGKEMSKVTSKLTILRYCGISVFPQLKRFNGSDISSDERQEAEMYFLALCSRGQRFISLVDPEKKHQRRLQAIYNHYGLSSDLRHTIHQPSASVASRSVTLRFVRLAEGHHATYKGIVEYQKKLPVWLTIKQIKELIEQQFKIQAKDQTLQLSRSHHSGLRVLLLDDQATLDMYNVEDGSYIYVSLNEI